jgi:hypothetical protein
MELAALVIIVALVVLAFGCIVAPLNRYTNALERGRATWPHTLVVTHETPGGAYRGSVVREEHVVLAPPRLVKGVAMASAFMGMMWIPSLPIVGFGILFEAGCGKIGPAIAFGSTGMALSLAIFVTGPKLLERKRVDVARFVAAWSILHNVAILIAIVLVTTGVAERAGAIADWQMYSLSEWIGWVALAYVAGSLVHAVTMLRAAGLSARTLTIDPEPDPEVAAFAAAVR